MKGIWRGASGDEKHARVQDGEMLVMYMVGGTVSGCEE